MSTENNLTNPDNFEWPENIYAPGQADGTYEAPKQPIPRGAGPMGNLMMSKTAEHRQ